MFRPLLMYFSGTRSRVTILLSKTDSSVYSNDVFIYVVRIEQRNVGNGQSYKSKEIEKKLSITSVL